MKNYLPALSPADFLIYGIYFFVLAILLLWVYRRLGFAGRRTGFLVVGSFAFFASFIWIDAIFDFVPYSPDADFYVSLIFEEQFPEGKLEGVQNFYFLSRVLKPVFLGRPELMCLYSTFFYFLALAFVRKTVDGGTTFQVLAALFPAAWLYIPLLLRESLLLLGFALTLHSLMVAYRWLRTSNQVEDRTDLTKHAHILARRPPLGVLWLVPGVLLLSGLRMQNLIFIAAIVGFTLLWGSALKTRLKLALIALFSFLGITLASLLSPAQYSPSALAAWRNRSVEKLSLEGFTYGRVDWQNWLDLLADVPGLVGQFLLSPLPILSSNSPLETTWIFVDMLFVLALLVALVFGWFKGGLMTSKFRLNSAAQFWLGIMLIFALLFGFYEYHLSGAVRHRMPFVLMLIAAVSTPIQDVVMVFLEKKE